MLSYFGVVPEGSFLDIPNAAIGTHFEPFSFDWSAFWCDIFRPTISKPSFVDWFAHFSTARFCLLLLLVVFEQILSKPGHYFGFLISNDQFGISSNQASHTGWIVHFVLVNPRHQCPAFLEYGCQFGLGWRCKEEERKGHQARMIIEVLALRKEYCCFEIVGFFTDRLFLYDRIVAFIGCCHVQHLEHKSIARISTDSRMQAWTERCEFRTIL